MKNKLKYFILPFLMLGLVSCNNTDTAEPAEIKEVYKLYVRNAEANGQIPASYEEWLQSIKGEKGDKGDNGADGVDGEQGPKGDPGDDGEPGKDGRSIVSITLGYSIQNVDTYIILYSDDTVDTFNVSNGKNGQTGAQGNPGEDGHTPVINIGDNGHWYIDGVDSNVNSVGAPGKDGADGQDGKDGADGQDGKDGADGQNGEQGVGVSDVYINNNGNLIVVLTDGKEVDAGNVINKGDHTHSFVCESKNATCIEAGFVSMTCDVCGFQVVSNLEPTGHTFSPWVESDPATCEHDGIKTRKCISCGYREEDVIPMHDHVMSEGLVYDTNDHWHYCTECGIRMNVESHSFENDHCSHCDYININRPIPFSDGLTFGLRADGESYCLISINNFEGTELSVPDTFNNLPVKEINSCISNNNQITTVVLPDSIEKIGKDAFSNCSSLVNVVLSNNLKVIPDNCFYNCSSLQSVVIPDSVISIGSYAFYYCSKLESVVLSNSLESICSEAFEYCSSLQSIVIPDSVTSIGYSAFSYCSKLESVVLSNCLESINENLFSSCFNLQSIVIPDSVTFIGYSAFSYCSKLESVVLSNCLESIDSYSFRSCSNLQSIVIPSTVTYVGSRAFEYCDNLSQICFLIIEGWVSNENSIYSEELEDYENAAKLLVNSSYSWYCVTFSYKFDQENSGYIIGLTNKNYLINPILNIPNCYNGYPVIAIDSYAFSSCSNLQSIVIPDSVTSIGSCAFYRCSSLQSIVIPESVTFIGYYAFYGCNSLTIYCEASSRPLGWDSSWNPDKCPVVWEYSK